MITFHIIRSIRSSNDDIIYIKTLDDTFFTVQYVDRDASLRYWFEATRDEVIEYMYSIFDMLRIDEEPFECVQMTLPAFPVIMLKIGSLNDKNVRTMMKPFKWSLGGRRSARVGTPSAPAAALP
jgi:hypothetical protein